ncbi:MAG: hypothetical protein ABI658_13845 [Acidimicrobiales bacterium]
MTNELKTMTWREKGVTNWARDCGFVVTKDRDLYHLSGRNPNERVLEHVELAQIERHLETL